MISAIVFDFVDGVLCFDYIVSTTKCLGDTDKRLLGTVIEHCGNSGTVQLLMHIAMCWNVTVRRSAKVAALYCATPMVPFYHGRKFHLVYNKDGECHPDFKLLGKNARKQLYVDSFQDTGNIMVNTGPIARKTEQLYPLRLDELEKCSQPAHAPTLVHPTKETDDTVISEMVKYLKQTCAITKKMEEDWTTRFHNALHSVGVIDAARIKEARNDFHLAPTILQDHIRFIPFGALLSRHYKIWTNPMPAMQKQRNPVCPTLLEMFAPVKIKCIYRTNNKLSSIEMLCDYCEGSAKCYFQDKEDDPAYASRYSKSFFLIIAHHFSLNTILPLNFVNKAEDSPHKVVWKNKTGDHDRGTCQGFHGARFEHIRALQLIDKVEFREAANGVRGGNRNGVVQLNNTVLYIMYWLDCLDIVTKLWKSKLQEWFQEITSQFLLPSTEEDFPPYSDNSKKARAIWLRSSMNKCARRFESTIEAIGGNKFLEDLKTPSNKKQRTARLTKEEEETRKTRRLATIYQQDWRFQLYMTQMEYVDIHSRGSWKSISVSNRKHFADLLPCQRLTCFVGYSRMCPEDYDVDITCKGDVASAKRATADRKVRFRQFQQCLTPEWLAQVEEDQPGLMPQNFLDSLKQQPNTIVDLRPAQTRLL